jgi:GDP-4-dehydro-6-deoxy-D-mannose reductase
MRILLTGATGFAGGWLAETLLAQAAHQIVGLSRSGRWPQESRHLEDRVVLRPCDLCDAAQVEAVLREVDPERIYHLAGYPHVGRSFQEPDAAWQGNLSATRGLFEAVLRWGGRPHILAVGSGMIYGDPDRPDQVFREDSPLRPTSPYAASKAAADLVGYQVTRSHNLEVVRARPFNHIGPRQSPQFAVANFARQLAEIRRGTRPPLLETGDLGAHRDLTDVRDVASAYVLLMEHGRSGEAYNVGSGRSYSMQTVLDRLVALAGVEVTVRRRTDLLRRADTQQVLVSADRLRAETGWTPRYDLQQTLQDTLDYWSNRV